MAETNAKGNDKNVNIASNNFSNISSLNSIYASISAREDDLNTALTSDDIFSFLAAKTDNKKLQNIFIFLKSKKGQGLLFCTMLAMGGAAVSSQLVINNNLVTDFTGSVITYSFSTALGIAIAQTHLKKYIQPFLPKIEDETKETKKKKQLLKYIFGAVLGFTLIAAALSISGLMLFYFPIATIYAPLFSTLMGLTGAIGTQLLINNILKINKEINTDKKFSHAKILASKKYITFGITTILTIAVLIGTIISGAGLFTIVTMSVMTGVAILRPIISQAISVMVAKSQANEMLKLAKLLEQFEKNPQDVSIKIQLNESRSRLRENIEIEPTVKASYINYLKHNSFSITTCLGLTIAAPILLGIGGGMGAPVIVAITILSTSFTALLIAFSGFQYAKNDYHRREEKQVEGQKLLKKIEQVEKISQNITVDTFKEKSQEENKEEFIQKISEVKNNLEEMLLKQNVNNSELEAPIKDTTNIAKSL